MRGTVFTTKHPDAPLPCRSGLIGPFWTMRVRNSHVAPQRLMLR